MSAENARHIRDMNVGELFTGFVVIRRRELRSKRDGAPYLSLEFGDRSGRISGNIWEDAERLYHDIIEGDIVKVQGRIEQYRDTLQIGIKRFRKVTGEDEIDPRDLLPVSEQDPRENLEKLKAFAASFNDGHLKSLMTDWLNDDEFADQFCQAPGGKLWHHNRIGGLIEHTQSMCQICDWLCTHYPEVNRDLLLAGVILHDIGKVEEYRYSGFIDYTSRGRFIGHISLGSQWVFQRAMTIDGFPQALLDKLQHLVLSHQAEFGSPVQPMLREAFMLHYVDQIDSKLDALRRISADSTGDEEWKYVRLLNRFIYFDSEDGGQEEPG